MIGKYLNLQFSHFSALIHNGQEQISFKLYLTQNPYHETN